MTEPGQLHHHHCRREGSSTDRLSKQCCDNDDDDDRRDNIHDDNSNSPPPSEQQDNYRCYMSCLNGLLHSSKTTTSFLPVQFQHGQYDLILDRPSIQKWWNHHHHNHGANWDTIFVLEVMRVLQSLHRNNSTKIDPTTTTTTKRKIRIVSIFISMDIFQKRKMMIHSPQEWLEHQQQQSNLIRSVLSIVKESLPQLQSVHLYNGQISSRALVHSVFMNDTLPIAGDVNNNSDFDTDEAVDGNIRIVNDDRRMPPQRNDENRLYHRWNRFHMDGEEEEGDDDDHDGVDALHFEIRDPENDEDDSEDEEDTEFPVMISGSILASIIESSELESMTVTRCLCFCNFHDVAVLAKSLQNHPTLSSMHLASMYIHPNFFMNGDNDTASPIQPCLDPIIVALSSLLQLESLNITLAKESRLLVSNTSLLYPTKATSNTIISPESLQQLIAGTNMKDLTLWECLLNGSHLSAISHALLYGDCGKRRCDNITKSRTEPKQTSLQFLSLRCNPNITCSDWCTFYTKTLPNCFSIQSIYNDHVCGLADCDPNVPQHGKTSCSGNNREGLRFWDIDTTTSDETTNSEFSSSTSEAAANAELFLGLNSLGRGSVIQGFYSNCSDDSSTMERQVASASENDENFVDLLSDVKDTPSALYALIRTHPMMILSFNHRQA